MVCFLWTGCYRLVTMEGSYGPVAIDWLLCMLLWMVAMDWLLKTDCYGGLLWMVAMDWLLWTSCYGGLLWTGFYGQVAIVRLLWTGCY